MYRQWETLSGTSWVSEYWAVSRVSGVSSSPSSNPQCSLDHICSHGAEMMILARTVSPLVGNALCTRTIFTWDIKHSRVHIFHWLSLFSLHLLQVSQHPLSRKKKKKKHLNIQKLQNIWVSPKKNTYFLSCRERQEDQYHAHVCSQAAGAKWRLP